MSAYTWKGRYSTRGLLASGGVVIEGAMVVHYKCENGDGGVLWEFSRQGNRWRLQGVGRARYAHGAAVRAAFPVTA